MKKENEDTLRLYRRLLKYVRPYRSRLVAGIICAMFQGGATFGMIVVLKWALGGISGEDMTISGMQAAAQQQPEGSAGEMELSRLLFVVFLLPVVSLLQGLFLFAGKYLVEWVGHRTVVDLRKKLFEHIHSLPIQFFTGNRVGELITRLTADTGLLTQLVSNVIGELIREPFTLIGCIAAMFYLDAKLSLIALVFFPLCILPVALFGRRVRKASKSGQEGTADMLSVVQESIGGAMVVKAFQMEEDETKRFHGFNSRVFKMQMKQTRAGSLNEPVIIFLSSIGMAGVVVYAYLNNLSLALLVSFGAAMVSMYKPFKKLSQIHIRIQRSVPGLERVFEILDVVNTVDDRPDAVVFDETVQSIEFKDVSFAYDEKPVLQNVSLRARSGQSIAFVGSSGAGKTTLVNLIPRFFDATGGAVLLNGKDIRDYTVKSLRKQIGVVTQQTVLFNRSVADNISYGTDGATQQEIEDAARRANAHEFIMQLEDGYNTVIGERGSLLSGGMAQRLAIARALLRNPPILILDEATSALDTESERLVQGALEELMKDRTVFVIAHRLSTIAHADQIVVMDKGRVVECGTHDELLQKDGSYKYFHDIQFSDQSCD